MSLYLRLVAAGCEIAHHGSDLYVRDTFEARKIILNAECEGIITNPTTFRSETDGNLWYELPFHYPIHRRYHRYRTVPCDCGSTPPCEKWGVKEDNYRMVAQALTREQAVAVAELLNLMEPRT